MKNSYEIINTPKREIVLTSLFLMPILNVYSAGISGLGMGIYTG